MLTQNNTFFTVLFEQNVRFKYSKKKLLEIKNETKKIGTLFGTKKPAEIFFLFDFIRFHFFRVGNAHFCYLDCIRIYKTEKNV
jgi:hypothetical protein